MNTTQSFDNNLIFRGKNRGKFFMQVYELRFTYSILTSWQIENLDKTWSISQMFTVLPKHLAKSLLFIKTINKYLLN